MCGQLTFKGSRDDFLHFAPLPRPTLSTHTTQTPCSYYVFIAQLDSILLICWVLASPILRAVWLQRFLCVLSSKGMFTLHFSSGTLHCFFCFLFCNYSRLLYHCTHTFNAAYTTCTFQYVTLHVPGVVITSRGAYSCTAAPDLGVFSKRVYGLSPDALNIYLILGNLQLHSLNFLHFSAITFCTSIWVTHILRHWLVCFLFLQFF